MGVKISESWKFRQPELLYIYWYKQRLKKIYWPGFEGVKIPDGNMWFIQYLYGFKVNFDVQWKIRSTDFLSVMVTKSISYKTLFSLIK